MLGTETQNKRHKEDEWTTDEMKALREGKNKADKKWLITKEPEYGQDYINKEKELRKHEKTKSINFGIKNVCKLKV